jgi:hypothetical protein
LSASDVASNWEKNAMGTSEMLEVAIGGQTMGRTQVFSGFASSKTV